MSRFIPQRDQHGLDVADDVFLRHEGGFDVDLRELGLSIKAQILVAEAARQLEVAVEPRHHEELFVNLR